MAQLLEGKVLAAKIKADLKAQIAALKKAPALTAISIGNNESSKIYVKSQMKLAAELGITYNLIELNESISQSDAMAQIELLNRDANVCAIILQLPVPKQIDAKALVGLIDPAKDAEGMHPQNLGKIVLGKATILPCTASSVVELIKSTGIDLYGKEVVMVGHSEIVGKPVSLLLLDKFATVTICHIATGQRGLLADHVKQAEILVVAVGKAGLIKGEWIKEGAIVVDVGINRTEAGIVGDIEFEPASKRAGFITPVPGGVGPLTTTLLMRNVVEASKLQQ